MNRRNAFLRGTMAFTAAIGMLSSAQAQTKPAAPEGVTIVIPLAAAAGKSRDEVVKAMQNIVAVIRKQPGLIDEVLMENKNPANKPTHVHVTRWREQKNWEAVFTNAEFQQAINANVAFFAVDAAGIYTPVK